jgi:p24 family protein beta-1
MKLNASICLLAVAAVVGTVNAVTTSINAGTTECYYEATQAGERLVGSYEVSAGGFLDIDVQVRDPQGTVMYAKDRQMEGEYTIPYTSRGEYEICFGNTMSTVANKVVSFNIRKGKSHPSDEVAKKQHVTPLEISLMDVAEQIMSVQEHQRYMNTRERLHRDTEESTNERVKWFSILEFVVLIVTNVWQIASLKAFFEKRRAL